jgi:hypothetical protein
MESPSRRACLQTLHLEPHIQGNAGKIAPHGTPRTKWPQKPWHDCRAQANLFDAGWQTIRMEPECGRSRTPLPSTFRKADLLL